MTETNLFTSVERLWGHTNFLEFQREYEDSILYADTDEETVSGVLDEPIDRGTELTWKEVHVSHLGFYAFDDWYIALLQ